MTNQLTTPQPLPYAAEIERDPRLNSTHTRRAYRAALGKFESFRAGRVLTVSLVEEYLVTLQRDGLKPSSVNHALATIRWWARRVSKLAGEYASPEDARRIAELAAHVSNIEDLKGYTVSPGRHMDESEIVALLQACTTDRSPAGRRDAAILAVAYATGARIHEIKGLTVEDITYTDESPPSADLLIKGKGEKERVAYLYNGALQALDLWINARGVTHGPLFNPIQKGGKVIASSEISLEGLRKILAKRVKQAAISKKLTWHDFRRTYIGRLLDSGADIATAQELAGHADPKTTAAYDRRPERRKREAVQIVTNITLEIPSE